MCRNIQPVEISRKHDRNKQKVKTENENIIGQSVGIIENRVDKLYTSNMLKHGSSETDLYLMHMLVYSLGAWNPSEGNGNIASDKLSNLECFEDCSLNNSQLFLKENDRMIDDRNALNYLLHPEKGMESICMFGWTMKNTFTLIIAKYKYKMKKKVIEIDGSKRYRLFVISSKMFEEAINESQKYHIQLAYTHVFPRDCRMFIAVPVYKDGYINEKDKTEKIYIEF